MPSDPSLDRRVSRLENDTESLYELVAEVRSVQEDHTRRFDQVDSRLDQVDSRLDRIDHTLDEVLRRLPDVG